MRIAFIAESYTEGMGYLENGLAKALAGLGHEVHVVASNLNAYGNQPDDYEKTYLRFLGPALCECGVWSIDGYTLHRLPHQLVGHYVRIKGLLRTLRNIAPDVIQASGAAGINTFTIAAARWMFKGRLFSSCHQSSSNVPDYLKRPEKLSFRRAIYFATRTLPGWLTAQVSEKCYAVTQDCAANAYRLYGVPEHKIVFLPLGVDTDLMHPVASHDELVRRHETRTRWGFREDDIVCVYTGRLMRSKNPALVAQAITLLRQQGLPYRGLFIGEGEQHDEIAAHNGVTVLPFAKHSDLGNYYRAADIAVWPVRESISMLDAAASGLPLVVPQRMADRECVKDNGLAFLDGSVEALADVLMKLYDSGLRSQLGAIGAAKMAQMYSWRRIAEERLRDYAHCA